MFASLIVHSLVHSWALPPARTSPGISVFHAGERNPLSRGYTSDVLLAMLMRFFVHPRTGDATDGKIAEKNREKFKQNRGFCQRVATLPIFAARWRRDNF